MKNIMVTFEGVHRGEKPFATYASGSARAEAVGRSGPGGHPAPTWGMIYLKPAVSDNCAALDDENAKGP